MTVPVTVAGSPEADRLRAAMVDALLSWGGIQTAAVEAAMRAVPRHLFVPEASLEDAYGTGSVITHRDERGNAISSASGPGVVSGMLDQLDVQPGHRVLEVGAGTGYNAACLAELAGPTGSVTTIDIGEAIVDGARRSLAEAGYGQVRVVLGDGHHGVSQDAPYDRIMVTAGAWDVPEAWREQLAPGGRLVVPLRMRGVTRSVALELDGQVWRSVSIVECGFMPMRGPKAVEELNIELPPERGVRIRIDDGQPVNADALGAALDTDPMRAWSQVVVPWEPFEHLDFWLAGASAGLCRVIVYTKAVEAGVVKPLYDWGSMGLYTEDTFAYLIRRTVSEPTVSEPTVSELSDGDGHTTSGETKGVKRVELGACAYGPHAQQLADEMAARIRAWGQARPALASLRIEIHPAATGRTATAAPAMIAAAKQHGMVLVIVNSPESAPAQDFAQP